MTGRTQPDVAEAGHALGGRRVRTAHHRTSPALHSLIPRPRREESRLTQALFLTTPGQEIVIEIGDDGRGLNREKIPAKAAQNGVIAPGAQPSDAEIYQLIFEPGFSTAEKVTDVSGRGVGMDVVRCNVRSCAAESIPTQPLAQDEETCIVYGMPREAVKLGAVDQVLPLAEIAPALLRHVSPAS